MVLIRKRARQILVPLVTPALVVVMISYPAFGQTRSIFDPIQFLNGPVETAGVEAHNFPAINDDPGSPTQPEERGRVRRGVARLWQDQKGLYRAPFQRSNIKWDVMVLAGTGALLATDRHIERHLPGGNVDMYSNISNIALGGTSAALALVWSYGIKTHNDHAKEMGSIELEALVNTFLIYTPMQFIAGRQRPGEGNGYGDFARHHNIDTSFPAGHPMFAMVMASVAAHEYPKPWVEALAYGSGLSVMVGRSLGRDHWASDIFIGSALGYFIGSHIFHSRCDPGLSEDCHSHSPRFTAVPKR